jgi:O-acetyl-ADP-ribose deacetylase (regulator of RNase III)
LVNTVNTVGVMGKGIALQFKRRFPGNYEAYRKACKEGRVGPGEMFVWHTGQLGNPQHIINFPTKRHWKAKSRIEDIEAGLRDLVAVITRLEIESIAVPPLGCGNGGLDWRVVRPLMEQYLADLDVKVTIYEPSGAPDPTTMPAQHKVPRMTVHRAAMVAVFDRYLSPGYTLGRLEAQKLIYFLKAAGAPYDKLSFVQGEYGPYADGIRHVLNQVEGHYIRGFGDAAVDSTMSVDPDASRLAEDMIDEPDHVVFRDAVDRVAALINGFDDPFGLELLASVHWVATAEDPPARSASEAAEAVRQWTPRKRERYDAAHVRAAWKRLVDAGFIEAAAENRLPTARTVQPGERVPVPAGNLFDAL